MLLTYRKVTKARWKTVGKTRGKKKISQAIHSIAGKGEICMVRVQTAHWSKKKKKKDLRLVGKCYTLVLQCRGRDLGGFGELGYLGGVLYTRDLEEGGEDFSWAWGRENTNWGDG